MKRLLYIVLLAGLTASLAWAKAPGILPPSFNGWTASPQSSKAGTDAALADPADSAVLKEFGFTDFATATYTRNGRKMRVKAARFGDATGAFGAFTFYRQPQMQVEQIGDRAASNNSRILFYRGNILADVTLEQVTAMSAADLRALAQALPLPRGNLTALPTLPGNLPKHSLRPSTERYIVGPAALERLGIPIPANLIDFSKSPEIEFAKYHTARGDANLTLIAYPTPQMAGERMRAIQAASLPGGPYFYKRSGPLLAVLNGEVAEADAQSLLAFVNFDADVTWDQPTRLDPREDRASFVVALIFLVIAVLVLALVLSFVFGGFRFVMQRFFPNRVFGRPEASEIIRLNLK